MDRAATKQVTDDCWLDAKVDHLLPGAGRHLEQAKHLCRARVVDLSTRVSSPQRRGSNPTARQMSIGHHVVRDALLLEQRSDRIELGLMLSDEPLGFDFHDHLAIPRKGQQEVRNMPMGFLEDFVVDLERLVPDAAQGRARQHEFNERLLEV